MKFTTHNGERFDAFDATTRNVAAAIVRRYIAATLFDALRDPSADAFDEMQTIHAALSSGARAESLEHTGGNVWISQTLHDTGDGVALLVLAGNDSLEVSIAAHSVDVAAAAAARWEDCGEDAGRVVVSLDVYDDGAPNARDAAAEKVMTAFAEMEKEFHARMVAAGDVNRPAPETNEDDAAMIGASDADLRAWCDDLESRVGMDVADFRAALESYIDARHAELFVFGLYEYIGAEAFAEMLAANAAEPDADVCHSHDYADANVIMAQACGQDEDADITDADVDAMNRAWKAAAPIIGRGFSAAPVDCETQRRANAARISDALQEKIRIKEARKARGYVVATHTGDAFASYNFDASTGTGSATLVRDIRLAYHYDDEKAAAAAAQHFAAFLGVDMHAMVMP